ncbi:hypothetical protein O181_116555 [Austropuccinia psidii MF-1]|uniref:Integrase catalytic domain-containing protein n=1 Tax=Austropuccinia psidii MF-1 TaxID=1389203 RepID=A0A9Q3K8M0_9BASI|nr:hypothetical protein [Austropuccinia psidii MF-1]
MEWVTTLPPCGEKHYNACLVIVDGCRKNPIFSPFHNDDTAIEKALSICNKFIYHTGLFKNIISDRYLKFTSALWTNLHEILGTKISFSTAYHPQNDGLVEKMINTIEVVIRRFCVYELQFKASDGFTHKWCALILALELAYKNSIHTSTGKTPAMLEKGWNPKLPADPLNKNLADVHQAASSFKLMFDTLRNH